MDEEPESQLSKQVGGVVERHGDEVADEVVKTTRFVRRFSTAVLVLVAVGFVAVIVFVIAMMSKF